ncbi:LysR family transcriptional regulator [Millisia brevis]|uniref:LysR family transcriptional regulator n=1 Tax=Millisia brevis TaxID=264148 RepID=UPI0014724CF8|nr:LysR family transcriptional regulator [Millisia brevis]
MVGEASFDFTSLAMVSSVARLGSLGAAARLHSVSREHIGARVRGVERSLGVTIFERSPTGVRTSAEGVAVVEWIGRVLDDAGRIRSGAAALAAAHPAPAAAHPESGDPEEPAVQVAATATFTEYLLPRWTAAMGRVHPGVRIGCRPGRAPEVIEAVRNGTVAVGFVEDARVPSDLSRHTVWTDELVVVVSPDHQWTTLDAVDRATLARTALVQRRPGCGPRSTIDDLLGAAVAPAIEVDTLAAVREAVYALRAPAVMSSLTARSDLEDGRLVRVRVDGLPMARRLSAVWDTMRALDGAAIDLVNLAVEIHRACLPGAAVED